MSDEKEKRKINSWLEDSEFIKRSGYQDTYYLESLCYHISSYLKNTPIPMLTTLDNKYFRIFFSIGQDIKKSFHIDNQVNPFDFLTKVKETMKQYYPQYSVIEEVEMELTEEEILEKVKADGMDLNDAINFRKKVEVLATGIIEKVFFVKDEFTFLANDKKSIRMAGTARNPMSVSTFLKTLKNLESDEECKAFIYNNSSHVKYLDGEQSRIDIQYQGKTMYNFWKINRKYIKTAPVKIDDFNYTWGRFNVKFDSPLLREDCLSLLNEKGE